MSSNESAIRAHHEWIGFLQPTGLVVSPPALVAAGAILDRNVTELQTRLEDIVRETPNGTVIADLPPVPLRRPRLGRGQPRRLQGHRGRWHRGPGGADVKTQREREKAEQKAKAAKRAKTSDEGQKGLFD